MSIEETIKVLEQERACVVRQGEDGCDRDCGFCDLVMEASVIEQAYNEAIALLRTHPDNQPNEELTEEQLRCMVGKWVWVTVHYSHCDTSGWAFVCARGRLAYFEQMLDISGCGTRFVARRRPPEEGQR